MLPALPLAMVADKDYWPNFEAVELAPVAGWFLCAFFVFLAAFLIEHREVWRRIWLRMEDPRPIAVFRIVFAAITLFNINGLVEHWEYLFTDEGMWSTDVAQQVRAKKQFAGYGDGIGAAEPSGFFGLEGFLTWLQGPNYSLLLFDSSPRFFYLHLIAFEVTTFMLMIGWKTKWVKWPAWFLFHSIILRNTVFWEGTENVYRCFLLYLCMSRCGQAYSVDNWLRCRRLRQAGQLSEADDPERGAGTLPSEDRPNGLQAIYRAIPAWPRMLMIAQTATIYLDTGVVKNGPVWHRGDAFYYAFNLDHFYRVEPQGISAIFGTNLFKLNTWITHYWEACFPLVVLGLLLRFPRREKLSLPVSARRRSRFFLLASISSFFGLALWTYPVHFVAPRGGLVIIPGTWEVPQEEALRTAMWLIGTIVPILVGLAVWIYHRMDQRPFKPTIRGRTYTLDIDWFCRWFLGRRLWLGLGIIFHTHLVVMMNIGWFTPAVASTYICFVNGEEMANLLKNLRRGLSRIERGFRKLIRIDPPQTIELDPILPERIELQQGHRDGLKMPVALLWTVLAVCLLGVFRHVQTQPDLWFHLEQMLGTKYKVDLGESLIEQVGFSHWNWFGGSAGFFLATVTLRRVLMGNRFDLRYGPVLVVGLWALSLAHERELLHIAWSLPLSVGMALLATRTAAEKVEDLPYADSETGRPRPAWAYGPWGRTFVTTYVIYQMVGVGIWLLPDKDSLSTFRLDAREPFQWFLKTTHTSQGWQMFAPNPPRSNLHMRVIVHTQDGEAFDMNNDVYACFQEGATEEVCDATYPLPWIWYSRQRKMTRRIGGGEGGGGSWYQKWHARWQCRDWAIKHGGELPEKVEIYKVTYPIPSPEKVWEEGAYDPKTQYNARGRQTKQHTTICSSDVFAQPPNEVRRRHGLEEVDEKTIRPWVKNRCRSWEKKLRDRAKEKGEEIDPDDPRFKVCKDTGAPAPDRRQTRVGKIETKTDK